MRAWPGPPARVRPRWACRPRRPRERPRERRHGHVHARPVRRAVRARDQRASRRRSHRLPMRAALVRVATGRPETGPLQTAGAGRAAAARLAGDGAERPHRRVASGPARTPPALLRSAAPTRPSRRCDRGDEAARADDGRLAPRHRRRPASRLAPCMDLCRASPSRATVEQRGTHFELHAESGNAGARPPGGNLDSDAGDERRPRYSRPAPPPDG